MGLSVSALLLVMLVAMTSLLQPSTSSSNSNSTAASWCHGRIDECLINAEAGDEETDDVLDLMVDFSEMSIRVLAGNPKKHLVISAGDGNNPVCGKSTGKRYQKCIAAHKNGGKPQNCKSPFNRDC